VPALMILRSSIAINLRGHPTIQFIGYEKILDAIHNKLRD